MELILGELSLVFSQVLVNLDIAPSFASMIDGVDIKLGGFDVSKLQSPEYLGCVVDKIAEGT